jgi:hypothetical protein
MIPYLGCEAAHKMLQPFVDLELSVAEQVALESHLRWCDTCATRVDDLRLIGNAVRLGSAGPWAHAEGAYALAVIQSEVLTRIRTEHDYSWSVWFHELFADMRFLWPALGATGALAVCLCVVASVNLVPRVDPPDSMADRVSASASLGSDRNPMQLDSRMLVPRSLSEGPALDLILEDEAVFALSAVVTREGRVANYELLPSARDGEVDWTAAQSDSVSALLDTVKYSRFTPAQTHDGAVAVNVVWLLARTTVKATIHPGERGSLPPLAAPEG